MSIFNLLFFVVVLNPTLHYHLPSFYLLLFIYYFLVVNCYIIYTHTHTLKLKCKRVRTIYRILRSTNKQMYLSVQYNISI